MQVRKFEAKSIKDAIELVKFHLGPDAIILSAKENTRGFGLMGEASVEVTAAISNNKLAKKNIAEKKLNAHSKERYVRSSARVQKQFIQDSFENYENSMDFTEAEEVTQAPPPPVMAKLNGITAVRYADIDSEPVIVAPVAQVQMAPPQTAPSLQNDKMSNLQSEIAYLKGLLGQFQTVPQNFASRHPGAEEGLPYELSFVFKKLLDAGVSHKNIADILKIANDVLPTEHKKKRAFIDGWVIKYLLNNVEIVEKPFKTKYHIFVGPTGQGKTSTVVKLACHLMMKMKKRIAILSGDHIKVGAKDQLKIYAQILNVPSGIISSPKDWAAIEKPLQNVDHVLLDTPGVNLRGAKDLDTLREVLPTNMQDTTVHYVQSIMARDTDAFEVAERFKIIGFNDVIFTRLDEAVQHGMIYNFQKNFNTPLHSFGIGNNIPEDFEFASKERVVDLLFNLSKIRKERG